MQPRRRREARRGHHERQKARKTARFAAVVGPRVLHLPPGTDPDELGKRSVDLCGRNGLELDDWQAFVLTESLKRNGDHWAAKEVGLHVPRQNGKTALALARLLAGVFIVKEPMSIYSAHLYDTSMEIFRRMRTMIEDSTELSRELKAGNTSRSTGVKLTHGAEGFEFTGDRRVRFRTRSKGGGRGWTAGFIFFDEAMILPEDTQAAMFFALSGASQIGDPQVWYSGSAVDQEVHEHGIVFARVRERGHKGEDPTLAWFDWSIEGDDPDLVPPEVLSDMAAIAQANPALGERIAAEWVEVERRSLSDRDFAVERGGVGDWPRTDHIAHNPIDYADWIALEDEHGIIQMPGAIAYDVSPERKASVSIAGKRKDGLDQVEVIESKSGTAWVAPLVARIAKEQRIPAVCDGRGPAASIAPEIRELGVEVTLLSSTDHAEACGRLMDAVERMTVRHLNDSELNGAVRAACTRPLGDAWAWSRRSSATNISPLVSATLALSAAMTTAPPRRVSIAWA
jgi:hypothetical protein